VERAVTGEELRASDSGSGIEAADRNSRHGVGVYAFSVRDEQTRHGLSFDGSQIAVKLRKTAGAGRKRRRGEFPAEERKKLKNEYAGAGRV